VEVASRGAALRFLRKEERGGGNNSPWVSKEVVPGERAAYLHFFGKEGGTLFQSRMGGGRRRVGNILSYLLSGSSWGNFKFFPEILRVQRESSDFHGK